MSKLLRFCIISTMLIGVLGDEIATRIIGGFVALRGMFPSSALIFINNIAECSGNIIGQEWLVTAAHCFINNPSVNDIIIYAGGTRIDKKDGEQYLVEEYIIHPDHDIIKIYHDISLVKVAKPFVFSKFIQRIDIGSVPLNRDLITAGWGLGYNLQPAVELKFLPMTLVSNDDPKCQKMHKSFDTFLICAKSSIDGTALCSGDSGAPLIDINTLTLLGIESFGYDGCSEDLEGFQYVKIYEEWIRSHVKDAVFV